MLNIYFGNKKDALISGNSYFDNWMDEACIETDFGKKIIKEIGNADVIDKNSVIHPVFGSIPTRDLAGGIKTLLILMFDEKNSIVDLAAMGDNCLPYLREIYQIKDITVCTDKYRDFFQDGDKALVLNSNKIVTTEEELHEEWLKV